MGEASEPKTQHDSTRQVAEGTHQVAEGQPTPPCHGAPQPVERLSGLCCCSLDAAANPVSEVASLTTAPSQPVAFDVDGSPIFRPQLRTSCPAQEVPARPPGGRDLLALHSILLL